MRPTRLWSLLLVAAVVAACGGDDAMRTDATPLSTRTAQVENAYFTELCGVLASVAAGDVVAARTAFDDGPLHELADTVIDVDRSVAARLLAAKEAVESDLADDAAPTEQVTDDLLVLTTATLDAYAIVGQPVPAPCDPENP